MPGSWRPRTGQGGIFSISRGPNPANSLRGTMLGVGQLRRWPGLSGHGAHPMAFVVIKRRAIFGAGGRHRRAAPGRQHDQRGSLAQSVVQARQPVNVVDGGAEFGIEEQQHSLKNRARHVQRLRRASQGLAAGIVDHLRCNPRRQYQRLAEFKREVFDVGRERRHFQRFDGACRARGGNPRRSPQRRVHADHAGSRRVRRRWRGKTCR